MTTKDFTIEGTHIIFSQLPKYLQNPEQRKTKVWEVFAKKDKALLGYIRWFGRWRCYAFYPLMHTVYEKVCLREIANFCEDHHKDRNRG